jgi:hypothetical protein
LRRDSVEVGNQRSQRRGEHDANREGDVDGGGGGARALAWTSEKREVNSSTWIVATITVGVAAILVYLLLVGRAMFSLLTLGLL